MRTIDPARHEAKRRQIIDAAAELFAAKGLDATTTAEICRAAGMSAGNVFHYFGGKRDIFFAVITDGEAEKASALREAAGRPDPLAALRSVVDLLIEPAKHPLGPPLVMEAMLQAQRDPGLAAWLARDAASERAALEALIGRARRAKQIDPGLSTRDTAAWVSAMVGAFYLRAATQHGFQPARQSRALHLLIKRVLLTTDRDDA